MDNISPSQLHQHIKNGTLELKVVPNAPETRLRSENGLLKLSVNAVADKNKANMQIIKFFKKEYGLAVEIMLGTKSRNKVLRIL